jgi:hypothetical protein
MFSIDRSKISVRALALNKLAGYAAKSGDNATLTRLSTVLAGVSKDQAGIPMVC